MTKVYIHGNCQAPAIASLLRQARPKWAVHSYEVFADPIIEEVERYREVMSSADIIISQPIHDGYRGRDDLSLSYVRSSAKPGATVLVFPSMHFTGQLIDSRSLPIQAYGMDYHNVALVHMVAAGIGIERIVSMLADPEMYPPEFVAAEIRASINEIGRREAVENVDVPFSPFLEAFAGRVQIFHAINHPCRPALVWIVRRILERLGHRAELGIPPIKGPEPIPFPHIPIPNAVARVLTGPDLTLDGWTIEKDALYHLPREILAPHEYYRLAARDLSPYSSNQLIGYLMEEPARSFLARLSRARPDLPGIGYWRSWQDK